ncbi:MAG: hypothetical protein HOH74_06660 [Gemmatimonadetes bacterium]|jgi:hypothetical protein|nr:hypothetical protein [Gemmatimonadota bacterium]
MRLFLLMALLCALLRSAAADAGPVAVGADSTATRDGDTAVDSTRSPAKDSPKREDPAWAWSRWPSIAAAVALAPLDGPQDILEKEEIIADRIDALDAETARLDTLTHAWQARSVAMTAQLEVLEDLADRRLGGDLELQQRVENVRGDVLQAGKRVTLFGEVHSALAIELLSLRNLSREYRQQAAQLRQEEENPR